MDPNLISCTTYEDPHGRPPWRHGDIPVTREMLDAGVAALEHHPHGTPSEVLVAAIYKAMAAKS